ncbi:MAG: hypothetical protein WC520_00355 [Candidatus Paceibacterota bacterium]
MENFEQQFDSGEENFEQGNFEVLKTPEISVDEEKGAQHLSLMLKAEKPEWGNSENKLAKETEKYFLENPLDMEVSGFLEEIGALEEGGVDEEALYTLALSYEHPERSEKALKVLAKHKSYIKNPQELQQKLFQALEAFKQSFDSSELAKKFSIETERDKEMRERDMEETKRRIEKLISFFRPDSKTTEVRRISLMPTDPLYEKDSGAAFSFGEELVLKNHIENPDNLDHEFLHSIINPIVEKLSGQLTNEQKEKVIELASEKLKKDYGKDYSSLLCEEFIRTYNDIFKKGEGPRTYEDFQEKLKDINASQFQEFLARNEGLRQRCAELDIKTVEDFQAKSEQYFERFENDKLRDLVFDLYEDYSNRPNVEIENFEQFVLSKFHL